MDEENLFGKRIKELRERMSLTQEEFAELCNLQPAHIGQLERGVKSPTLDTIRKIASGLQITVSLLLDFAKNPHIPNDYGEVINKIVAHLQGLPIEKQKQILEIVKTFRNE